MQDVTNNRLDVKTKAGAVDHANEDNEFLAAISGLEKELGRVKTKKEKRRNPLRKFQRVSARQQQAVGRL
jgi:desulfoferrodoxin (superoxide reductase-like protein)